jgi:hypothetical protein
METNDTGNQAFAVSVPRACGTWAARDAVFPAFADRQREKLGAPAAYIVRTREIHGVIDAAARRAR